MAYITVKTFYNIVPPRMGGGGQTEGNVVMQIAVVDENQNMTDFL